MKHTVRCTEITLRLTESRQKVFSARAVRDRTDLLLAQHAERDRRNLRRCSSRSTETMLDWQPSGSAARRQGSSRRSAAAPASSGSVVPGSQRSLLSDPDEDEFGAADEPASPPLPPPLPRAPPPYERQQQQQQQMPDCVIVSSRTMDRFLPSFGQASAP
ncbi:hypothetical protein HPB50_013080 [Hyalomma asiaticum]|uniref:Uncharacterized protein n=1 Tax=Hyalomma asiaticum TaxID=266040 RepID=A0ACB7RUH0_HYAAI|nr:hypothetical protein HPB50_013080 [Hyalomma asiaticum]